MLDEDVEVAEPEGERPKAALDREVTKRRIRDGTRVVTFAVFAMVFFAAVIGNWQRTQDVDPMYVYDIVLRTAHFGGTYYQNGINDWGPGEPFLYSLVSHLTSHDAFWYGISFLVAVFAVVLGAAAARTAQVFGGNRDLAVAVGAVVFVHFTLSGSTYAGVIYVRNITTVLLAIAWLLILYDWAWGNRRRALITAIATGACLGIAVQNLLTTAFTATAVALVALALVRVRRPAEEHLRLDIGFVGAGAVAFFSAPVWYALRGSYTEFFSGWWTYASYMSTGTGQSLGTQFSRGWDQFYVYYEDRPLTTIAILAFVAMVLLDWTSASKRERILYAGLLGWFAGSWIELILSQRYSANYFTVSSVATALMIAALAGRAFRAVTGWRGKISSTFAWPLVALTLAIYLSGPQYFVNAMRDLSNFTSVHAHTTEVAATQSGDIKEARAVLDVVSKDWDPLLVWTNDPWPYLDYHRISATRFIWKSFLLGEIYLGRTSPSYVLPHTWEWFGDDLKESNPTAFLKSNGGDIPPDSPFQQYVNNNMKVVYPASPIPISFRNDVAAAILTPATPEIWHAPAAPQRSGTGWTHGPGTAEFRDHTAQESDVLQIAQDSCFALSGTVSSDGAPGGMVFWFNDNAGKRSAVNLDFDGDHVSSADANVEFHRLPTDVAGPGSKPTPFTLIVGRRAAALVVNGQIRAAVELPKSVSVTMGSQRGVLDVHDLRTGSLPAYAC